MSEGKMTEQDISALKNYLSHLGVSALFEVPFPKGNAVDVHIESIPDGVSPIMVTESLQQNNHVNTIFNCTIELNLGNSNHFKNIEFHKIVTFNAGNQYEVSELILENCRFYDSLAIKHKVSHRDLEITNLIIKKNSRINEVHLINVFF